MIRILLPGAWWPTWVRPKRFVPNWLFILSLKRKWSRFYEVWPWAVLLFFLLATPSSAQIFRAGGIATWSADTPLEQLIAVRAKLIKRYVGTYAWGVSVCGNEDVFNGSQHSWLTVYVYQDSIAAFTEDFNKFATKTKVDGVTVVIVEIERPK